jgi:processive 1,2-diacylglycerol beta-glucosyltransferase
MSAIHLFKQNPDTYEREPLGTITEEQLDFLVGNLEEEFDEDEEYFLSPDTLDYLREQGADTGLISMLDKALAGSQDGVDIFYTIE